MSNTILFHQVVEYVESLSAEEQDLLLELIHKRRIEQRRSEIARNYSETLEAMKAGKAKIGTVADLRADFNNLNITRSDELIPFANREEILACAPESDGEFFKVPKILNEEES